MFCSDSERDPRDDIAIGLCPEEKAYAAQSNRSNQGTHVQRSDHNPLHDLPGLVPKSNITLDEDSIAPPCGNIPGTVGVDGVLGSSAAPFPPIPGLPPPPLYMLPGIISLCSRLLEADLMIGPPRLAGLLPRSLGGVPGLEVASSANRILPVGEFARDCAGRIDERLEEGAVCGPSPRISDARPRRRSPAPPFAGKSPAGVCGDIGGVSSRLDVDAGDAVTELSLGGGDDASPCPPPPPSPPDCI